MVGFGDSWLFLSLLLLWQDSSLHLLGHVPTWKECEQCISAFDGVCIGEMLGGKKWMLCPSLQQGPFWWNCPLTLTIWVEWFLKSWKSKGCPPKCHPARKYIRPYYSFITGSWWFSCLFPGYGGEKAGCILATPPDLGPWAINCPHLR